MATEHRKLCLIQYKNADLLTVFEGLINDGMPVNSASFEVALDLRNWSLHQNGKMQNGDFSNLKFKDSTHLE